MGTFRLETRIEAPPTACFELSLSVDAHTASMGDSGETAVGGVTSGTLGLGDTVTWRARHFGVVFEMTSRIAELSAPGRFVDEQTAGPFATWWHEHTFEALPGDGTLMTDRVVFRAPLGPLGRLAEALVLDRYMPRLLRERNDWLKDALEGHRHRPPPQG